MYMSADVPLVYPWNKPPLNYLAELVPVLPVLLLAVMLISKLAMDKEYSEIGNIEIGEKVSEPTG